VEHALGRAHTHAQVDSIQLVFSAKTSSTTAQAVIELGLQKKRRNTWGSSQGRQVLLFVDDVNMPQRDQYGAQPPIELLRLLKV
jgi:dynein heavy chain, axonemal